MESKRMAKTTISYSKRLLSLNCINFKKVESIFNGKIIALLFLLNKNKYVVITSIYDVEKAQPYVACLYHNKFVIT